MWKIGLLLPTAFGDGKIRGQLDELTEQLNSLDSWLSEADQQRSKLLADLRKKDRAVAEAAKAVAASDAALGGVETQLEELRAERNGHLAKQSQEAGRIGGHVAATHRLRGEGFLRLLLDQSDPTKAERMLVYHRHLINARMEAYKSFRRASAQLRHNAEALAARRIAERAERQRRRLYDAVWTRRPDGQAAWRPGRKRRGHRPRRTERGPCNQRTLLRDSAKWRCRGSPALVCRTNTVNTRHAPPI